MADWSWTTDAGESCRVRNTRLRPRQLEVDRDESLSGFSQREMHPGELLKDPAADPALDAIATELLRPQAAERAAKEQERARRGMARTRATRRKIIADLLAAGHTGPSILAIIAAAAAEPAGPVPAWVAEEIKRQRP